MFLKKSFRFLVFLLPLAVAKKTLTSSPYVSLSKYISRTITSRDKENISETPSSDSVQGALQALSSAQSTLKSIDGASHEFYQRSHNVNTIKGSTGRVERSAGRLGCCADALFGCELIDFMMCKDEFNISNENFPQEDEDTMSIHKRSIVLETRVDGPIPTKIIVIREDDYRGGAGIHHGGIDGVTGDSDSSSKRIQRGRIFVLLRDEYDSDLEETLNCIDQDPEFLDLNIGLVSGEIVGVNKMIWLTAQKVLRSCSEALGIDLSSTTKNMTVTEETARNTNITSESDGDILKNNQDREKNASSSMILETERLPAIHFVGRSLAGGIASISAAILEGSIPMEHKMAKKKSKRGKSNRSDDQMNDVSNIESLNKAISGFGQGRTSAVSLGGPPSISANIKARFITSVIHGDDIVCRASKESLDRLRKRTVKRMKGGLLAGLTGGLSDTLSLTVSSIQSHAHGSEGEEGRLSIPGKVFLIRPRRISGGVSSIHEIGKGRDALRASILWQLNDILLSKSMWKHHSLDSYIHGIDKVQLREIDDDDEDDLDDDDER